MILLFRKFIVRILIVLSFISLLAGGYIIFRFQNTDSIRQLISLSDQIWWLMYTDSVSRELLVGLAVLGEILFAFIAGLYVFRQIRKNPSPELSFLYIFIFSLSLQVFRLNFLLPELSFYSLPIGFNTKVVYFSRFLGLSAFFAGSLFSTGLQIQKFSMILLISFLTSFTLSTLIPVNTFGITGSLLHRIAREKNIALFCTTMELLTVLNYLSAAHKQGRNEFYRLALFSLLVLIGYELLFFLYMPLIVPGFLCLILGTFLFIRASQKLYLWS